MSLIECLLLLMLSVNLGFFVFLGRGEMKGLSGDFMFGVYFSLFIFGLLTYLSHLLFGAFDVDELNLITAWILITLFVAYFFYAYIIPKITKGG